MKMKSAIALVLACCMLIALFALPGCGAGEQLNRGEITTEEATQANEVDTEFCEDDTEFWIQFFSNRKPTLTPDISEPLLHGQNIYGYWGDLIPFYDQATRELYMYYMIMKYESPVDGCTMHLSTSTDLFNFCERQCKNFNFVNAAVNLDFRGTGIGIYDIFDYDTYPYGPRDWYYFYDFQVNRWRYVALSYIVRGGVNRCALSTAVSDDEEGTSWTQKSKVIAEYTASHEPECPWAMWINDRWYIGCSLSTYSIHNVGRPQYLIGEPGKGIDEQDWVDKEPHYIDGEDLCASQLIDVGGRYLLYGWIPQCKENEYFDGTMDFTLWGGVMSIMREVYQLPDGSLGTRLPSPLKEMVKKELLSSGENIPITQEDTPVSNINCGACCITFETSLPDQGDFRFRLLSGEKGYDLVFSQSENSTQLTLGCEEDSGHPIYSEYTTNRKLEQIQVLMILEGSTIEVFVNDEFSLTARTSIFSGTIEGITASADEDTILENYRVYQLATSQNIYDDFPD